MNRKLQELKQFIQGKRVAVLGVGISNKPLIRYISRLGADITAFDMAEENDKYIAATRAELEEAGVCVKWSLGAGYLDALHGFDIIFKTPKVRSDIPQLVRERDRGVVITSEMEVFLECCPCRTIAVTGSSGKTTTTSMISLILEREGYRVHLGGNIGTPLLDRVDTMQEDDIVVLELSSFQLHSMRKSPDVAVITNITPNHLDVHKNFEEYIDAKKNIFLYQNFMGRLVLNANDPVSAGFYREARGETAFFPAGPSRPEQRYGAWYDTENFHILNGPSLPLDKILLPGRHNLDNYCAAITAVLPYVSGESALAVMRTFAGVAHRSEFIRQIGPVVYYNSSIDSSPSRTIATLQAFIDREQRVVIIAGGKDKNSDYSGLGEQMLKAGNKIILCGQNTPLIRASLDLALRCHGTGEKVTIYEAADYREAVEKAAELAEPGEAVLLTPAGTSFDRFHNFEERGEHFRTLVNALPSR